MSDLLDFVPELRTDVLRRSVDGETIVWSPLMAEPTVLDPVAAVMLDVIDGDATVGQLANEVHEEVGLAIDVARHQVARLVEHFGSVGLLTASTSDTTAERSIRDRELFVNPCTSCMENAVRGMSAMSLRFGDRTVGVACDARRGIKKLRAALADHVVTTGDDAPVGFVLTAPAGLQRSHHLADRSGFVHSRGRGLDAGLHALASHLTAFLPPAPGTVRVRVGAMATGDRILVCLFPLLLVPPIEERELATAGYSLVDRLALDVEVATGRIVNPDIPWDSLAALSRGLGHLGSGCAGDVVAIVSASPLGSVAPSRAAVVASLAAGALHGEPVDILEAMVRLVDDVELLSTEPEAGRLAQLASSLASNRT